MSNTGKIDRKQSYQNPAPELFRLQGRSSIWKVRYRRYLPDGTVEKPWEVLGDQVEFPTETSLRKSEKFKSFIERINSVRVVVTFCDLTRNYIKEEIPKRVPKGQATTKGHLKYLEDKWGEYRLDQLIQMKYDIKSWLQGDLPLFTDPDQQASRQTRRHLRTLFVMMMTYAVDKHYLPYNPFTGTALAVKKGGAAPVDRSQFYVTPEQFRWMMSDPETPGHVKMMQRLAYSTGIRMSEFLGLRWEDIEFDTSEPRIYINRSVDGAYINDFTKTDTSKAPVPMCELLAGKLISYKEEYPSVNGWLFGSDQTGRPLWGGELQRDHHLPALLRMGARFKVRVPSGIGFHSYRHSYNALIGKVSGTSAEVRAIQMQLLRQGDEATNKRYGKSAQPTLDRARAAATEVAELLMGEAN